MANSTILSELPKAILTKERIIRPLCTEAYKTQGMDSVNHAMILFLK